jgi:cobyrinic acid a,c-diamide synthase
MAGLLPLESTFQEAGLSLGYRHLRLIADGPLGRANDTYRGHEFHYTRILSEGRGDALFEAVDATGAALPPMGRRQDGVMGSFAHLIDRADAGGWPA